MLVPVARGLPPEELEYHSYITPDNGELRVTIAALPVQMPIGSTTGVGGIVLTDMLTVVLALVHPATTVCT